MGSASVLIFINFRARFEIFEMEDQERECYLLQGASALVAQLLLGFISFSALYMKRQEREKFSTPPFFNFFFPFLYRLREHPQRPTSIWAFDVSKQIVGMACAHTSGLLIAITAHHTSTSNASQCAWYFVAFTFDTTLGVALTMTLHKLIIKRLQEHTLFINNHSDNLTPSPSFSASSSSSFSEWRQWIVDCGDYGQPPEVKRWAVQAGEWAVCVVAARAVVGVSVLAGGPLLHAIADDIDVLFTGHPTFLLYSVMICCPLLMNAAQLLVQDALLKARGGGEDGGGDGGGGGGETLFSPYSDVSQPLRPREVIA